MSERRDPVDMVRADLPGGLTVVLQSPPPSAQSFSISYLAPAGWGFEPPAVEGLASVVAKLAVGRPGGRSREAVARTLDRYGAALTSAVAPESAKVTLWGPADAWEPLVELFADSVLRPHFASDELQRALRQLRERQLRQLIQPDLRSERDLLAEIFPVGHPYRSTGIGTEKTAAKITLEELRRFHRRHYPARGSALAVTIRKSRSDLLRTLARRFPHEALGPDPDVPSLRSGTRRSRRKDVAIKGQRQVAIRIGGVAAPRSDPHYPEMFLLNEVLGGRPLLSRLFQRVRERHGLAYHASSELEAMRWGGYWEASAGTDPSTRDKVVQLMLREIERLHSDLIPSSELDRIRESALGSLPLELDTTASAHELAVDVAYHRLPVDFYRTWPAQVRALGPRELRTAAEVGFPTEGAWVVTAGPPAG
jgi:zinc protease